MTDYMWPYVSRETMVGNTPEPWHLTFNNNQMVIFDEQLTPITFDGLPDPYKRKGRPYIQASINRRAARKPSGWYSSQAATKPAATPDEVGNRINDLRTEMNKFIEEEFKRVYADIHRESEYRRDQKVKVDKTIHELGEQIKDLKFMISEILEVLGEE